MITSILWNWIGDTNSEANPVLLIYFRGYGLIFRISKAVLEFYSNRILLLFQ